MSSAFVKENEEQWLNEIMPTTAGLINYLSRENNNVRVYLRGTVSTTDGTILHQMSNGLDYFINAENQWTIWW